MHCTQRSFRSLTLLTGLFVLTALTLRSTPTHAIAIPGRPTSKLLIHGRDENRKHVSPSLKALSSARLPLAMAIPGYGLAEQVFVGGFSNFLQVYNLVITARILLSWFPQAQGVGALQPIFAVTDPYLNLFRGIIPPIGGFDLSPLAAFFVLSVAGQVTSAIGCELPESMNKKKEETKQGKVGQFVMQQQQQCRRVRFSVMK